LGQTSTGVFYLSWFQKPDKPMADVTKNLGEYAKKGGPGRPKGSSGRTAALALLDKICRESETQALFEGALRKMLAKDPIGWFNKFVVPFAPKELSIDIPAIERGLLLVERFTEGGNGKDGNGKH